MPETGFWEREGKSPVLGAIIVTTIIAGLYSLAGNLVVTGYMLGDLGFLSQMSWTELQSGIIARYRTPLLIITMVFEFLFFGLGTWLVFRSWHRTSLRERFRLGLPSPASLPFALVGAAGLFPLALYAGELFERAFPFIGELQKPSEALIHASDTNAWILLVAAI